jgi:hypothetical protein
MQADPYATPFLDGPAAAQPGKIPKGLVMWPNRPHFISLDIISEIRHRKRELRVLALQRLTEAAKIPSLAEHGIPCLPPPRHGALDHGVNDWWNEWERHPWRQGFMRTPWDAHDPGGIAAEQPPDPL